MAYSDAHAQVVTILETYCYASNTPLLTRGAPSKFKHFPDASDAKLPKARGFWLRGLSHWMLGPYTPALPQRHRSTVELSVCYPTGSDPSADDKLIAADHREIATQLLSAANWNRPTSTIITVSLGEDLLMPATIDRVDGAHLLRVVFPMEYTS